MPLSPLSNEHSVLPPEKRIDHTNTSSRFHAPGTHHLPNTPKPKTLHKLYSLVVDEGRGQLVHGQVVLARDLLVNVELAAHPRGVVPPLETRVVVQTEARFLRDREVQV